MEFFLEILSICYNRTGAFLVAGVYVIEYDREFVILLVNLLVRLTVFRSFSVFHPLYVRYVGNEEECVCSVCL